ncbi:hypothetical protein VZT92_011358 [Zoarces viviparus]|uniref:Uncharacterized protein n=1 Tax=Zoarces viviparus TaxID=48416 RepID=A0AAW1FC37_ZOAVI
MGTGLSDHNLTLVARKLTSQRLRPSVRDDESFTIPKNNQENFNNTVQLEVKEREEEEMEEVEEGEEEEVGEEEKGEERWAELSRPNGFISSLLHWRTGGGDSTAHIQMKDTRPAREGGGGGRKEEARRRHLKHKKAP